MKVIQTSAVGRSPLNLFAFMLSVSIQLAAINDHAMIILAECHKVAFLYFTVKQCCKKFRSITLVIQTLNFYTLFLSLVSPLKQKYSGLTCRLWTFVNEHRRDFSHLVTYFFVFSQIT